MHTLIELYVPATAQLKKCLLLMEVSEGNEKDYPNANFDFEW